MSGARLAMTAVHGLRKTGGTRALVTMCIGVGQGLALATRTRLRIYKPARAIPPKEAGRSTRGHWLYYGYNGEPNKCILNENAIGAAPVPESHRGIVARLVYVFEQVMPDPVRLIDRLDRPRRGPRGGLRTRRLGAGDPEFLV